MLSLYEFFFDIPRKNLNRCNEDKLTEEAIINYSWKWRPLVVNDKLAQKRDLFWAFFINLTNAKRQSNCIVDASAFRARNSIGISPRKSGRLFRALRASTGVIWINPRRRLVVV